MIRPANIPFPVVTPFENGKYARNNILGETAVASEEPTPMRAWWTLATPQITELQVSLVYGLAFAAFFCLAGLPIGYAIER